MKKNPTLHEIDNQVLTLVQSIIGAITQNFRMITLSFKESNWIIDFYFEREDQDDLDEIDEILGQYSGYQTNDLKYKYNLHFGAEPIYLGGMHADDKNLRIIYKRKEE